MVRLQFINSDVYQNRYLVFDVDDPSQVYLVPTEYLENSFAVQEVDDYLVEAFDVPYRWDDELEEVAVTINEMRLALLYAGLINRPETTNFKEMVAKMLLRGTLPIVLEDED